MTTPTKNKITKPKLVVIAPLTNSMVNLFIWLNALIAVSILGQAPNPGLIIINSYFMSYVWAGVFMALSLFLVVGKLTNNWGLIKHGLVAGLFTKLIFTYALVVVGFQYGWISVVGILALWVAIVWVQFFTVMYFNLPGEKYAK